MPKVLISDQMSPRAAETFKRRGVEVDERVGLTPGELIGCIGEYDGLAVRSATKVTAEVFAAALNLKVVGRAGIGVDNIDIAVATGQGVCVMNTPFGNAITTAEHTVAMMLALARQIAPADHSTQAGKWEKSAFMGVELYGKTLGIIGCGNIGSIVADRALGLKMRVVAYDPYLSEERARGLGLEKLGLQQLFERADFITLHTPLTDATRGLIDAKAIEAMKPEVRIINCARGGLVNEADLLEALEAGRIAGVALDVFAEEPAHANPLFGRSDVVATPHLGASTAEAQVNVAIQVAEQMSDYLLEGAVVNAVNMASVSAEEAPKLRPYIALARQLGSFAGQLTETAISEAHIEFEGHVATLNTRPLVSVLLEGLLSPLLDNVNMVNAAAIAKQRNIDVKDTRAERLGDFQTLIRLSVTTERQKRSVSGTLFADSRPRIVEIKGINLDAELSDHMLYLTNEDKPGFIGALGTTLGEAGVNIATFHLGRAEPGGDAIALIAVDQEVEAEVLKRLRALPHVVKAQTLSF